MPLAVFLVRGGVMDYRAEIVDQGALTDREAEILRLVCEAKSDKDIARLLDVSIHTVQKHIEHVYSKLGVTHARLHRRLLVLRSALAAGMVRLLLLVLVVGAVDGHDDVARVGRSRLSRPQITRLRRLDV